jgi:hypothetical protein
VDVRVGTGNAIVTASRCGKCTLVGIGSWRRQPCCCQGETVDVRVGTGNAIVTASKGRRQ